MPQIKVLYMDNCFCAEAIVLCVSPNKRSFRLSYLLIILTFPFQFQAYSLKRKPNQPQTGFLYLHVGRQSPLLFNNIVKVHPIYTGTHPTL